MGLKGKLVGEFEVKSSAENFHHQFRHKPHHISSFSEIVQDCELHGGEFGQPGCTICWRYNELDGKSCSAKQVVEFDEETKTIVFTVIEGDLMADYNNFVITLQSVPREGENDLVRWTLEYEKIHEDSPHPVKTLDVLLNVAKHIEIDHVKTA